MAQAVVAVPASFNIATFQPEPASATIPEFIWGPVNQNPPEFFSGAGAIGTGFGVSGPGDGQLPAVQQQPPGLLVVTPYNISGIPGGINSPSGTSFYDATLKIVPVAPATLGFRPSGPAGSLGGIVVQPLGAARFEIWSTDPIEAAGDVENPVLLLSGLAETAEIKGLLGDVQGLTLSALVTYDGGAILAASGLSGVGGSFSWALNDVNPPLNINSTTGFLVPFSANGNGQFSIPEPASMALLGLTALPLLRRKRTR
ncbi:MAG: hypothetical protein NT031_07530 [Planctomycetota bacterium]|nr:hypothetical protein [Planctomycetota bacterium]